MARKRSEWGIVRRVIKASDCKADVAPDPPESPEPSSDGWAILPPTPFRAPPRVFTKRQLVVQLDVPLVAGPDRHQDVRACVTRAVGSGPHPLKCPYDCEPVHVKGGDGRDYLQHFRSYDSVNGWRHCPWWDREGKNATPF